MKKSSTLLILFIALYFQSFSQTQPDALIEAMGLSGTQAVPPSGYRVTYAFSDTDVSRASDGESGYMKLLTSPLDYDPKSQSGKLIGVYLEAPGKPMQIVTGREKKGDIKQGGGYAYVRENEAPDYDPMRPNRVSRSTDREKYNIIDLDSMQMAEHLNSAYETASELKAMAAKWVMPVWMFCLGVFLLFMPLFVGLCGIGWIVADLARNEMTISVFGQSSTNLVLVIAHRWGIGLMYFLLVIMIIALNIHAYLWMLFNGFELWIATICWIGVMRGSVWFGNWIMPNIKTAVGGRGYNS